MSMGIAAYEPLYQTGQTLAESEFRPLAVAQNSEAWREFRILIDFYRRGHHRLDNFSGILSPKFRLKTGVSGRDFVNFVSSNPDADVCIINPYPGARYLSYNVWMHGEAFHPGIVARGQALLNLAGIDWDLRDAPRNGERTLCYSNFWIGSAAFWESYVGGVLDPIARFLEQNPDDPVARDVMDPTTHYTSAPFLPFIVERLFSTFLALHGRTKIAVHTGPYERVMELCDTEFERDIVREMRPVVDACDNAEGFSPEVKNLQALHTRLFQKYVAEYYARHPHPHTGRMLPSVAEQFTRQLAPGF
ncbi:hypothetical protein BZM26_27105 [Paraburkholderia strydomiana]|nr:hypothetical protein BZM26_27105 [Paraburkholderia strydomiana]